MNAKKERVLVVLPYGMCFRNFIFNESLWGYLTDNYVIDVLTAMRVKDKEKLHIDKILNPLPRNLLNRIRRSVNYRILHCLRQLDYCDYYLTQDLGTILDRNYKAYSKEWRKGCLFWGAVNNSCAGYFLKKIFKKYPFFHPVQKTLKENKYKFIVTSHVDEEECILTTRVARKLGIPTICITLGVDNIMNSPMLCVPDLLLLWGPDQASEYERFQVPFNEELKKTKCLSLGNLMYDNYLKIKPDQKKILTKYNIDSKFILFPALTEAILPGQMVICERVLKFIRDNDLKLKLVVRVRPGYDENMWLKFKADNEDLVVVQIPDGASYNKSSKGLLIDHEYELQQIEEFVTIVKSSSLVLDPSWSTVYLDALALNTPAVFVCYPWNDQGRKTLHPARHSYQIYMALYPSWDNLKIVLSEEELITFLDKFFIKDKDAYCIPQRLFEGQAFAADGRVGHRAVDAIQKLINI